MREKRKREREVLPRATPGKPSTCEGKEEEGKRTGNKQHKQQTNEGEEEKEEEAAGCPLMQEVKSQHPFPAFSCLFFGPPPVMDNS